MLFNFRAGGNYNPIVSGNLLPEGFSSADIPLDPINRALIGTDNIHAVVVNGRYTIASGASKGVTASTTYHAGWSMTKILGRHTLKIGYEHRRFYDNFSNAGSGVFRFIANPVHQIAGVDYGCTSDISMAYGMAAFMIGVNSTAAANATGGGGVRLSDGADSGWHASNDNLVHMISSFANPYQPSDFSKYERTTQAANFQSTGPTGPSAFNRDSHMPYELTWSFGIQRELTRGLLVEGAYSGNHGESLLGPDLLARVPREIFSGGPAGQNARTYTTAVASPTAGQTLNNAVVGLKQPLAVLESAYPYFGIMAVLGSNIGRSNYHASNLRAEQRLWRGLSFLANYTFSKSLDDVGGPNQGTNQGISTSNLGGKRSHTALRLEALPEKLASGELAVGRGARFRLGAEAVRDQALAVAGLLSEKMGGPPVMPPQPAGLWRTTYNAKTWVDAEGEDRFRRGLYTYLKRTTPYPSMTTFDGGSGEVCTMRRIRTNTPLQALITLNDPVYLEAAAGLARRMIAEAGTTASRAARGLRLALIRPLRQGETLPLVALQKDAQKRFEAAPEKADALLKSTRATAPKGVSKPAFAAWIVTASAILNLDEFLSRS